LNLNSNISYAVHLLRYFVFLVINSNNKNEGYFIIAQFNNNKLELSRFFSIPNSVSKVRNNATYKCFKHPIHGKVRKVGYNLQHVTFLPQYFINIDVTNVFLITYVCVYITLLHMYPT
jgi:hypothetical protein